jgi:putative DNA primase/helicase
LDIEISVIPGDTIEIVQRKSKDAEEAKPVFAELQSVPIKGWMDEDGEQVTSAVLVAGADLRKQRKTAQSSNIKSCLRMLGGHPVQRILTDSHI